MRKEYIITTGLNRMTRTNATSLSQNRQKIIMNPSGVF